MNTNFALLKSPHIPAMLSFEWQAQGRPLNSFIAGFKTLHFKKYKSYSQMNEGWVCVCVLGGVDERELLMCPVGRHKLNLPEQLKSSLAVRWLTAQPGTHFTSPKTTNIEHLLLFCMKRCDRAPQEYRYPCSRAAPSSSSEPAQALPV